MFGTFVAKTACTISDNNKQIRKEILQNKSGS
jgi:hypothetical protein